MAGSADQLLNKSCCTLHMNPILHRIEQLHYWESPVASTGSPPPPRSAPSGTMGNLQSKGLTGPCQHLLLLKTKRLFCKSSGVMTPKRRRSLLQRVPETLEKKRGPSGSWIWLWLHGLWLYLKLPHAFFRSNTTITTSTNTPWRTPILTNKLWHKNLFSSVLALLLSTVFNLGGSSLFSLIDYLWFSSVPVEFTHYQLRTVKNITKPIESLIWIWDVNLHLITILLLRNSLSS